LNDYVLKKYNFASMYKIEHDSNILFSGIIKILGGVAIDRSNDRQAVKGILEIINKVKNGQNYMIYPEGTRSHSKKLNEYHAGSFKVFQKTESSLVVIAIDGADKKGCFIPLIPTHLYFEIVDVFDSDEMRKMPTVELAAEVKNITEKALHDARKDNWFLKE
jgi:1-acyl-sn-glycerol-3-phosphate acyltransferase